MKKQLPELKHTTPHMLRNTSATLAKQAALSLNQISETLTHSNSETTMDYINSNSKVNQTVGDIVFKSLKND